ncbi:hypothetical protein JCM11251_007734 [Rhodosporidiobolus azoricus]
MVLLRLLACLAAVHLGAAISILSPQKITKGETAQFAWSDGKSTFTVRILVNSHEVSETYSVEESKYDWKASDVKVGDTVQVWIYDSAGAFTKTPPIEVVDKASGGEDDDKTATNRGSKTVARSTTPASKTTAAEANKSSGGKKTATGGSSGGGSKTSDGGGGSSRTSTERSYSATSSGKGAQAGLASSGTATAVATALISATSDNTATGIINAGGDLSSSSSSSSAITMRSEKSNKPLLFGLAGIALALLLCIALGV